MSRGRSPGRIRHAQQISAGLTLYYAGSGTKVTRPGALFAAKYTLNYKFNLIILTHNAIITKNKNDKDKSKYSVYLSVDKSKYSVYAAKRGQ